MKKTFHKPRYHLHRSLDPGEAKNPLLLIPPLLLALCLAASFFSMLATTTLYSTESFRKSIEESLARTFSCDVDLGTISIRPGRQPKIIAEGLRVSAPVTHETVLSAPQAVVTLSWRGLFSGRFIAENLEFTKPYIDLSVAVPPQPAGGRLAQKLPMPKIPDFRDPSSWEFVLQSMTASEATVIFRPDRKSGGPAAAYSVHFLAEAQKGGAWQVDAVGSPQDAPAQTYSLQGVYQPAEDSFSAAMSDADETLMFEGEIKPFLRGKPQFEGEIESSGISFQRVMELLGIENDYLEGEMTAHLEGRSPLTKLSEVLPESALKGAVDIRKGRFIEKNIVRESLALALDAAGGKRKSPEFNLLVFATVLEEKKLPFDIAQANIEVVQGQAFVRDAMVKHESYAIEAEGKVSLADHQLDMQGKIVLMEKLTQMVLDEFPSLGGLVNEHGRMVLPFMYRGLLPNANLKIDSDYVEAKISAYAAAHPEEQPPEPAAEKEEAPSDAWWRAPVDASPHRPE
ncbi:MAG TPA: AsmA-like C-terminal region-containing protein [Verrucomicrobiae bacterium]|jgi:hypothetical protein|nr:AsmA-like C-terminal region-containing protein [Verrucomicrobiae bacterium]